MKNRVRFFFLFLGLLGALAVHAQINELPRSTPEAEGVPSKAVTALFDSLMALPKTDIHSVVVLRHGTSGNVTTTYDKLIQNYADLHAKLIDATIAQGQAQEILDVYADVTQNTDPRSAEAQWASARIDELVQKFTSLYDLALMTIDEFNQVNGADNIEMKNSIVVTEKLNLKLYAALSVLQFPDDSCS